MTFPNGANQHLFPDLASPIGTPSASAHTSTRDLLPGPDQDFALRKPSISSSSGSDPSYLDHDHPMSVAKPSPTASSSSSSSHPTSSTSALPIDGSSRSSKGMVPTRRQSSASSHRRPSEGSPTIPGSQSNHASSIPTASAGKEVPADMEKGCVTAEENPARGPTRPNRPRKESNAIMRPVEPWKRRGGWSGWMAETVSTPNMVPALIMQAFSTGILDATTYADFTTFASNQTGNTILLTVSVIGTLPILVKLTAISLGSFLFSAFIFGNLGHFMGVRRRSWLLLTTLFQCVWLTISAVLVSDVGPTVTQIGGEHDWIVLFFFASMSGAQVAMARQSGSQELPTAPMTSSYVDLMADKYLFYPFHHPKAGPRNRRLAYVLSMIVGGLLGACIHKFAGSWEVVTVTIGLKLVVFVQLALAGSEQGPEP